MAGGRWSRIFHQQTTRYSNTLLSQYGLGTHKYVEFGTFVIKTGILTLCDRQVGMYIRVRSPTVENARKNHSSVKENRRDLNLDKLNRKNALETLP